MSDKETPKKLDKPLFKIIPDSIVKAGNNGYYYCQTEPPYPAERAEKRSDRKAKYVYYHRALYEQAYGFTDDQIDHIDGNKEHNVLSNLQALPLGRHQALHSVTNHFWKSSPFTKKGNPHPKPKTASILNVVQSYIQSFFL